MNSKKLIISDGHPSEFLTGGSGDSNSKASSVFLIGGGLGNGDFEDGGVPSWDGWNSEDWSNPGIHWNVSDFNCQNLDPGTSPNHAWWCGETFSSCSVGDDPRGYGSGYLQALDWYGEVSDPSAQVSVYFDALINCDLEPGYDFLYLQVERSDGYFENINLWDGLDTYFVHESFNVLVEDFVPHPDTELPSVHLRWVVDSDGAYDQSDCAFPNDGAAQIDEIKVYFDQGTQVLKSYEDNEDPDPADNDWHPVRLGVGDFAKVWPLLEDIDPCPGNSTPAVAFIDDGEVVPGTGGSHCLTWCYGPGGYVVNSEGGILNGYLNDNRHLNNRIVSPVLVWPGSSYGGGELSFDVYPHLDRNSPGYNGVFYVWGVKSTSSSDPADLENEPWLDHNFVYGGEAAWIRRTLDVSDLIAPDSQYVQVMLGVYEIGWILGYDGNDSSPGPYFDNVSFVAKNLDGPAVSASEVEFFQDNFPENGAIQFGNIGQNNVRIDIALDVSEKDDFRNDPGDSMVFRVNERYNSPLLGPPRLFYKFAPNPLFDSYRDPNFSAEGYMEGIRIYFDDWGFDLPDSNWFFPGDVFHWYIEVRDGGNPPGLTLLPADTTGFSLFPGDQGYLPLQYPISYVVRALPSLKSAVQGDQPKILFWADSGGRGGLDEWLGALTSLGLSEGVDFDLYYTNAPSSREPNGLGGRATVAQIEGYETILYSSGDLLYSISDSNSDLGDDVALIDSWLRLGGKNLFVTGDDIVNTLFSGSEGGNTFLDEWAGVSYVGWDLNPYIGNQKSPLVKTIVGNPVFSLTDWVIDGDCPEVNYFDCITVRSGTIQLAEFTDPDGNPGAYPYAGGTLAVNEIFNAEVICLPYDLMFVETAEAREGILRDVLAYFAQNGSTVRANYALLSLGAAATDNGHFTPDTDGSKAIDDDPITGWVGLQSESPQTISVSLPNVSTIDRIQIVENNPSAYFTSAEFEYFDGQSWVALFSHSKSSPGMDRVFPNVTTDMVRMLISGYVAPGSPGEKVAKIHSFEVYGFNQAPESVEILSPVDNLEVGLGDEVVFSGIAHDLEDGPLPDEMLAWTSSIDGFIGSGSSFTKQDLSLGAHVITLTANDSLGLSKDTSVSLVVENTLGINFSESAPFVLNTNRVGFGDSGGFSVSGVSENNVPTRTALGEPAPNPFNPVISIPFTVSRPSHVELGVYDVRGRRIISLESGQLGVGWHERQWDGRSGTGSFMSAGVYFIRISGGGIQETKKVTLLK